MAAERITALVRAPSCSLLPSFLVLCVHYHSTRQDMVRRRREEGSTVVVLIARGMMDTRLVTWNTFHGARTGDVDAAATSLLDGLTSLASANGRGERRQVLAGVGYSMGERVFPLYRMLCFVFVITRVLIFQNDGLLIRFSSIFYFRCHSPF